MGEGGLLILLVRYEGVVRVRFHNRQSLIGQSRFERGEVV